MRYRLLIKSAAEKDLRRLPDHMVRRINRRVHDLGDSPYGRGVQKLSGSFGYRARVGPYRVIYTVNDGDKVVEIVAVRHRREAYR